MPEIRTICLIDSPLLLERALQELGCTVHNIKPETGPFFNLPDELARRSITPDLVFQCEMLGRRVILTGLSSLDCPLMFWATDPHLNAHWHAAYARLFDITCSTQRKWIPRLRDKGAGSVHWLPTYGHNREWIPMADREHDLAFVGRVTTERPARQWMVDFLRKRGQGYNLAIRDNMDFMAMMELYRTARMVPNESILGEINFRLFEGASCGALVLTQDLGEEQAELYEPGREIDTYAEVVELGEKLERYLGNPRLTETMGRAAYQRTRAEHMPIHRARRILELADGASRNRATGDRAAKWTELSACAMLEGGQINMPHSTMLSRLARLGWDGDVTQAMLRVQAMAGDQPHLAETVTAIVGGRLHQDHDGVNVSCSMAALRLGDFDKAKACWYRHVQATGSRDKEPPRDPVELLTLWAKNLHSLGRTVRPGFPFDPARHLPATATDCLLTILADHPEHLPTLRLLDTMLRPIQGFEQARVGFLSILTLHERNDWRLSLEIGLANLTSYRLESGIEELRLAQQIARDQGQERGFERALAARNSSGRIARYLGKE